MILFWTLIHTTKCKFKLNTDDQGLSKVPNQQMKWSKELRTILMPRGKKKDDDGYG